MSHGILAFDLATRTGWAYDGGAELRSGFFDLPATGGWAEKLAWFTVHVRELVERWNPLTVVAEEPQFMKSRDAARVCYSLWKILGEVVRERAGRGPRGQGGRDPGAVVPVYPSTLKKWATGSGKAQKPAMLRAAQAKVANAGLRDHNEADAILLARYGREELKL